MQANQKKIDRTFRADRNAEKRRVRTSLKEGNSVPRMHMLANRRLRQRGLAS